MKEHQRRAKVQLEPDPSPPGPTGPQSGLSWFVLEQEVRVAPQGTRRNHGATERREVRDEAGGEKLLPAALLRFWRDLGQRAADDPSAVLQTEAEGETRGEPGRRCRREEPSEEHPPDLSGLQKNWVWLKRRAEENRSTHTFNHRLLTGSSRTFCSGSHCCPLLVTPSSSQLHIRSSFKIKSQQQLF